MATEIVAQFFTYDYKQLHPWEEMLARDLPYSLEWNDQSLRTWDEILATGAERDGEDADPEVPKSYSCLCCDKVCAGNTTTFVD